MVKYAKRPISSTLRTAYAAAKALNGASKYLAKRTKKGPSLRGSRRTRTRTTQAIQKVRPAASGSTFSAFKKILRPQRGLSFILKSATPRTYTRVAGATLKVAQNTQNYHDACYYDSTDLAGLYGMVTTGLDGASAGAASDVRFYVNAGHLEYLITNGGNTNMFVDIFELTCRRDQSVGSATSGTGAFLYTPKGEIDSGLSAVASAVTLNTLGFSPFQSRRFCQTWKCDKWITIELEPGKTHKHNSVTQIRRFLERERLTEAQNFGNLTRAVLIRARGMPVCDSVTDTNVALSEGELQIVMIRKLDMMIASNPTGYAVVNNSLSTVTSSFMNVDTGAKVTYSHA